MHVSVGCTRANDNDNEAMKATITYNINNNHVNNNAHKHASRMYYTFTAPELDSI